MDVSHYFCSHTFPLVRSLTHLQIHLLNGLDPALHQAGLLRIESKSVHELHHVSPPISERVKHSLLVLNRVVGRFYVRVVVALVVIEFELQQRIYFLGGIQLEVWVRASSDPQPK